MNLDENKSTALKNTVQQQKNDHKLFTNQQIQNRIYTLKDFHPKVITSVGCTLKFQRLRGYDNNRGWQNIITDSETNIHYISSIIAYNDQA